MTVEELQVQVANLTQQIQGLAADRNSYRERLDAAEAQLQSAPPAAPATGSHPFAGVINDPSQADAWVQQQIQALFQQQGFVSQQQVNALVTQASQAATRQAYDAMRGDTLLWRGIDHMTSQEKYKALADPASPLSQAVGKILQEKGWGTPRVQNPQSFATDWNYLQVDPNRAHAAFDWAVERALMDQSAAAPAASQAVSTGAAAQAAAGLSVAPGTPAIAAAAGASPVDQVKQGIANHTDPSESDAAFDAAMAPASVS